MNLGTLTNTKAKIVRLMDIFDALGGKGQLTLTPEASTYSKIELSPGVVLEIQLPTTLHYDIQAGSVLVLTFNKPYPVIDYKSASRSIDFVQLTTTRIDISINWSPDAYFEVAS